MTYAKSLNAYPKNKPKKLDGVYKEKLVGCRVCKGTHHPMVDCTISPMILRYKALDSEA